MATDDAYHSGSRELQDRFDSRRIADRLAEVTMRTVFTDEDRAFIERCPMFFLATADTEGRPDCSYRGGMPGFVRVINAHTLAFPDYDGNGMFRSLGNVRVHPQVGMLFIDFEHQSRLRVNGVASVHEEDALLPAFPGAQLMVRVRAERIFPNCPRYIHKMHLETYSVYCPSAVHTPPVPEWKEMEVFRDHLPKQGE